jgi:hypothetical protein
MWEAPRSTASTPLHRPHPGAIFTQEARILSTRTRSAGIFAALGLIGIALCGNVFAQSSPQPRIVGQVSNQQRTTVQQSVSALVKRSQDKGRLSTDQKLGRMVLLLAPSADQEKAAARLVASQQDSSSPQFHKWLTPAQYGDQFGVAPEDAQKVQQWLQSQGFGVNEVSQSRRFVVFTGTVGQVEAAFSTQMHSYSLNKQEFIANSTNIQIPAALAPVVKGVVRLNSDPEAPALKMGPKIPVNKKTGKIEGAYGQHYLGPADFATIYNTQPLLNAGIDGTGQTIAIVSRSSLVQQVYGIDGVQDIRDFRNAMGLPANDPEIIVNGDDPLAISYDDTIEALLDVTWAGAVAPKAHIVAVASASNFADGVDASAAYIVDHNVAPIMSVSFGSCEQILGPVQNAFYSGLWQQASAQGITVFVSAGDNGGAGCDDQGSGLFAQNGVAVSGLASTPYNIAVGGTQFDDTADPSKYWNSTSDPTTLKSVLSYIPEMVWNESSNDPFSTSLWAGSGGVSTIYAKPDWQTAAGVPNDGMRDIPDISLAAAGHTGYALCFLGSCSDPEYLGLYTVGGTSASSPSAAGIMALVLQKMKGQPQGLANYTFYKLASTSGVYHDITKGNNKVPDPNGDFTVGYDAGPGYDLATGLGTLDANALVNNWGSASAGTGASTTLAVAGATSVVHGTPIAFAADVTCSGNNCTAPTGSVALQAKSAAGDVVGVGSGSLIPGTPTSNASIATSTIPGGTYNVSARYGGDGTYTAGTSNAVSVTVSPESSQMMVGGLSGGSAISSPLSVSYGEPVPLFIAVAGLSGNGHPSGTVSLLVDGSVPTIVGPDFKTPGTLILNYGERSGLFTNGATVAGQSSVFPNLTSGFAAGTHQVKSTYPGDNSFKATQASYSFAVTKEDSVIVDFFPYGTPVAGVSVTLGGQIVLANNGCAPYGGTVTITDLTSGTPVVLGTAPASQQYCDSFTIPVTFKAAGNHLVRVDFTGDSNVNASYNTYQVPIGSNTYSYVSLGSDVSNAVSGGTINLMAQVGSDVRNYVATGTVTFLDGTTSLGTATLDATGTATLAVSTLTPGTHNIMANYSGDAVLQASSGGPLTEMVANYSVQAQPAQLTVGPGQSASATLSVLPIGGSTQTIQFSCGSLPANLTCTFAPATVTLDGTNIALVKMTVQNGPPTTALLTNKSLMGIGGSVAFALMLVPFGRRRRLKVFLIIGALAILPLSAIGCGGSGNSSFAKPGTYAINVTMSANSGPASATTIVVNVTK